MSGGLEPPRDISFIPDPRTLGVEPSYALFSLSTPGGIRTPNAQVLSLSPLPLGYESKAHLTGFEPAVVRSTGGCIDRYATDARPSRPKAGRGRNGENRTLISRVSDGGNIPLYYVPVDNRGIEPRPDACKTPVLPLTPVAQRDQPGSRTLLRRFAGGVTTLVADHSCCTRTRTEEVGLYRPALLVPGLQQRKKVESNHRPVDRPPLAGEVRPTAHIFQSGK